MRRHFKVKVAKPTHEALSDLGGGQSIRRAISLPEDETPQHGGPSQTLLIRKDLRQVLSLFEVLQHPTEFSKRVEGNPKFEAEVDRVLEGFPGLGQIPKTCQRLL